jgi:hypothetical protein
MQENDMNLATRTKTLEGIVTYSLFVMKFSLYINLCDSSWCKGEIVFLIASW